MKKTLSIICGLGCLTSIVLAGGQAEDGSCDLPWTLGFLALAALCGWAYGKLTGREARRNG